MQCEAVRERLVDGLTGAIPERIEVERHLESCVACRAEQSSLAAVWNILGAAAPPPVTALEAARVRARFDALMDVSDAGGIDDRQRRVPWMHAAAAVLLLGLGFGAGRQTVPPPATGEIDTMRVELRGLRQMVTLSLMQQQAATDRLKGVSWSSQIDNPSADVVQALIDALRRDPNVNVRLASIDALERFADRDDVRQAALDAMETQSSPLVQVALIELMVKMNHRGSVPVLKQLAESPQTHEAVRDRASWGLQRLL